MFYRYLILSGAGFWGGGDTQAAALAKLKSQGTHKPSEQVLVLEYTSEFPFVPFSEVREPRPDEAEAYVDRNGDSWSLRCKKNEVYRGPLRGLVAKSKAAKVA